MANEKYLDKNGVLYLWQKLKLIIDDVKYDDIELQSKVSALSTKITELETSGYDDTELKQLINECDESIKAILAAYVKTVKVNGVEITSANNTVDISVPTKVSELANDSAFIKNTVADLTNYYDKTKVDNLISAVSTLDIKTVTALPTENISSTTIYFLSVDGTAQNDAYDEYVYIDGKWEKIGSTRIDLSGYLLKSDAITNADIDEILAT